MRYLILLLTIVMSNIINAQEDCDDYVEYLEDEVIWDDYITFQSSSAIEKATYYREYEIAVIEFTSNSEKYIFCQISLNTWAAFREDSKASAGEAYHKYIKGSNCDCGQLINNR